MGYQGALLHNATQAPRLTAQPFQHIKHSCKLLPQSNTQCYFSYSTGQKMSHMAPLTLRVWEIQGTREQLVGTTVSASYSK